MLSFLRRLVAYICMPVIYALITCVILWGIVACVGFPAGTSDFFYTHAIFQPQAFVTEYEELDSLTAGEKGAGWSLDFIFGDKS